MDNCPFCKIERLINKDRIVDEEEYDNSTSKEYNKSEVRFTDYKEN